MIALGVAALLRAKQVRGRMSAAQLGFVGAQVGPLAEKVFLFDGPQIAHLPARAVVKRKGRLFALLAGISGTRGCVG